MEKALESIAAVMTAQQEQLTQHKQESKLQMATMMELIKEMRSVQKNACPDNSLLIENLTRTLTNFRGEEDQTFGNWYKRYVGIFLEDGKLLDDGGRVRLLMRKLDQTVFDNYSRRILPKRPEELVFKETVAILTEMYKSADSQFCQRLKCLRLEKSDLDDFDTYVGKVNMLCEEFSLGSLTVDSFKCLMFIVGLKNSKYSETVTHLLNFYEKQGDKLTINHFTTEAKRIHNLKVDTQLVAEHSGTGAVQKVEIDHKRNNRPKKNGNNFQRGKTNNKPAPSSSPKKIMPCWCCGQLHLQTDCNFGKHTCKSCGVVGHKDGYRSSAKRLSSQKNAKVNQVYSKQSPVKRLFVTATINNAPIEMQLDSGSDISIISAKNYKRIGAPSLSVVESMVKDAQHNTMPFLGKNQCPSGCRWAH